jgi:hypothetical protein
MEDIRLPRQVIDRLENRWASRLQQDARAWSSDKARPFQSRHVQTNGARIIPVTVKRARRTAEAARFE